MEHQYIIEKLSSRDKNLIDSLLVGEKRGKKLKDLKAFGLRSIPELKRAIKRIFLKIDTNKCRGRYVDERHLKAETKLLQTYLEKAEIALSFWEGVKDGTVLWEEEDVQAKEQIMSQKEIYAKMISVAKSIMAAEDQEEQNLKECLQAIEDKEFGFIGIHPILNKSRKSIELTFEETKFGIDFSDPNTREKYRKNYDEALEYAHKIWKPLLKKHYPNYKLIISEQQLD